MARSRNTDILHLGEGAPDGATPLGRPIYTSSTFVFANAAEVEAYQRGETRHYLYARWGNQSVEAAEETLAAIDGAEAGGDFRARVLLASPQVPEGIIEVAAV